MPKFNHSLVSFQNGEISPRLRGRRDLEIYNKSAEELLNMVVSPTGECGRRPGTVYVTNGTGTGACKLIDFIYSRTEAYVIELTNSAIRIINANDKTTILTVGSGITATSGTLFTSAELPDIQYAQSADVMVIVHPDHMPLILRRTAADTFEYLDITDSAYTATVDHRDLTIPFEPENTDTSYKFVVSSSITVGASATITVDGTPGYVFTVGEIYFIVGGSAGADAGTMMEVTSGGTDTCTMKNIGSQTISSNSSIPGKSTWRKSYWKRASGGGPRSVTFNDGRVIFGGNQDFPDTFWGSKAYGTTVMMGGSTTGLRSGALTLQGTGNEQAYTFTLLSNQVNEIQWIIGNKFTLIGSLSNEYLISASDGQSPGASDILVRNESARGSKHIDAVQVEDSVLFVDRTGKRVYRMYTDSDSFSQKTSNISLFADHMTEKSFENRPSLNDTGSSEISNMAFQKSPNGILWCVTSNGDLIGVTIDFEAGTIAWHYHELGGQYDPGGGADMEAPYVRSVCSVPSPDGSYDELWICCTRDINGSPVNHIEYLGRQFEGTALDNTSTSIDDKPVYLDCAKYTTGASVKTFAGYSHITGEGSRIGVLADGVSIENPAPTESSGTITITRSSSRVVAGLKNTYRLKTNQINDGAADGSAHGSKQRVDRIVVKFRKTVGGSYGRDSSNLTKIQFREVTDSMITAIPLFTGDKVLKFESESVRGEQLVLEGSHPYPVNVVAISLRGVTND